MSLLNSPDQQEPVVLANLYMSHAPSIKFVFKSGEVANFVHHRYYTTKENEIRELDYEIKVMKHPAFYINPRETKVNPAEQDPLIRFKKKVIEEYLRELAAKTDPNNDMGNVTAQPLTPTSTTDVAAVAAGGSAESVKARLSALLPSGKFGG